MRARQVARILRQAQDASTPKSVEPDLMLVSEGGAMPSPFPGMDPYIEQSKIWSDFHLNLTVEIQGQLNRLIRPRYVARLTPLMTYETVEVAIPSNIRPALSVHQLGPSLEAAPIATVAIPPAPAAAEVPLEFPLRQFTVEIRMVDTMTLVTAIEVLSPANKQRGQQAYSDYRIKRRNLLHSLAHFIEIDLLRGGRRSSLKGDVPPAPYYITLSRVERRPHVEWWPIQLPDKLPTIPVPLLQPDPDVRVDLGAALTAVYERGGYAELIDYAEPPPSPPLAEAEQRWLDERLRQQKLR